MKELLLKLLGVKAQQGGDIEHWSISFTNLKTPFQILVFLLITAALGYGVWWFYKREPDYCPAKKRKVLAGFRYAGLLILMFILSGPVLELVLKGYVKGKVVILVDSSKSMTREDKYRRPEDKLVAAHVLGEVAMTEKDAGRVSADAEKKMASTPRMELVRSMFQHPDIKLLEKLQEKYDVEMWSFSRATDMKRLGTDLPVLTSKAVDDIDAEGTVTEIGGALRETLKRLKGQPLSAMVLVTDGGNNRGEDPTAAAQDSPVRIFPIGIGVPESHDVAIINVFCESKIFVDDLAPIYVRIKQHGFAGEQAQLIVSANGDEIKRQNVTLRDTAEQNEIIRVKPTKAGHFTYKIEIKLANNETEDSEPNNNFKNREVDVIDQKINVLLLESDPRWEYRYIKNSLLRDKRVSAKIFLKVPDAAELSRANPAFLKEFPTREELFKFHVIIFGNMPNDGFFTEGDIDNLRRFVMEEGGGIWFIAGKNNFPDGYKDSKLEILLPVEFERNSDVSADDEQQQPLTEPRRLMLTSEGRTHSVTRLDVGAADSDDKNAEFWDLMPDVYWFHRATRPKLNATPLLVIADDKRGGGASQRSETIPVLVSAYAGRGRVVYQAVADLWRMRYPQELGPDALERFHGHMVQYLGLPKLLGRTARIEISTDKEEYGVGDRVRISSRVLTKKDLDYSTAEHITALITDVENESNQTQVDLTPEPGQRGSFRGEMTPNAPGKYRVTLKDEDDEKAGVEFNVIVPQVEMESPDMKKELLENLAKSSVRASDGGKAGIYLADQAGELVKDLNESQRPMEERKENTLWDAPILLILFTLFMGLEWLIRKRSDLL